MQIVYGLVPFSYFGLHNILFTALNCLGQQNPLMEGGFELSTLAVT